MNDLPHLLACSVLTSCSERYLEELFAEVRAISGVDLFDLMVLRTRDVRQLDEDLGLCKRLGLQAPVHARMMELLAHDQFVVHVLPWIVARCCHARVRIAALATYFPDVTSQYRARRELAIRALANAGRLALGLTAFGCMDHPVVEVVAGTVLDPCSCSSCSPNSTLQVVFEFDRFGVGGKLDALCDSLRQAIKIVQNDVDAKPTLPLWPMPPVGRRRLPVYAVELEPGPTYVIRDEQSLLALIHKVDADPVLAFNVALNVDIAHYLIANVPPTLLDRPEVLRRIAHAHIADHPGLPGGRMHTRDLYLGSFTTVERAEDDAELSAGEYYPFLRRLLLRARQVRETLIAPDAIPFTGAVAIELEGCNRIFWIHQSVGRLNHAFRFVAR